MGTVYCDGSYLSKYNIMGVGIICDSDTKYIELPNFKTKTHEIEAIISSIEYGLSKGFKSVTVVNDDKGLVRCINDMLYNERKIYHNLYKLNNFKRLMRMIKKYKISIRVPTTEKDWTMIHKSHNLSRTYLKRDEYNSYRRNKIKRTEIRYKKPITLVVGDISKDTISKEQYQTMDLYYRILSNYDDRYTIENILKWIENRPSQNTKNGRKYAVAQFVKTFC